MVTPIRHTQGLALPDLLEKGCQGLTAGGLPGDDNGPGSHDPCLQEGAKEDLKNWRSIMLLNFNNILLAKALAESLNSVIGTVIY